MDFQDELLDSLADLYHQMCEEDLWAGLWQKHAHYRETSIAITYEQHGFFEKAQSQYEAAMDTFKSNRLMSKCTSAIAIVLLSRRHGPWAHSSRIST